MSNEPEGTKQLVSISEAVMQSPWHEGDTSATTCTVCGNQVNARYETRNIRMKRSAVTFSNILVSVCSECDSIALPRQSLAQIMELSAWK